MIFLQTESQISWILVVTFLANRLQIYFVKFSFDRHLLVAGGAGKVVDTPGFIEGSEHIALYHLITHITQVTKQLVIVSLTVGKTLPLVVTVTKEWFLALGTHKMLDMPMFAQCSDHSLLNWSPACATYWYSHLVMAPETVKFIEFLSSVARSGLHLSGAAGQLNAAARAVEMVGMIHLTSELEWLPIHHRVTFLTHVFPNSSCFDLLQNIKLVSFIKIPLKISVIPYCCIHGTELCLDF